MLCQCTVTQNCYYRCRFLVCVKICWREVRLWRRGEWMYYSAPGLCSQSTSSESDKLHLNSTLLFTLSFLLYEPMHQIVLTEDDHLFTFNWVQAAKKYSTRARFITSDMLTFMLRLRLPAYITSKSPRELSDLFQDAILVASQWLVSYRGQ